MQISSLIFFAHSEIVEGRDSEMHFYHHRVLGARRRHPEGSGQAGDTEKARECMQNPLGNFALLDFKNLYRLTNVPKSREHRFFQHTIREL